jgi:hypothetical protein
MTDQQLCHEWKTVTVEPSRLSSGLWGHEEGDIAASYSADTYGEKQRLRSTFAYAHTPHAAMSISGSFLNVEAKAYPVVHSSYADEIMTDYQKIGLKDGYTGKAVRRHGNECIFGLPVIFRQRALKKAEMIDLTRRMYAYGGYFAKQAGTYQNLLREWSQKYEDPRLLKVLASELEDNSLPRSQEAMREFIQSQAVPNAAQLALF